MQTNESNTVGKKRPAPAKRNIKTYDSSHINAYTTFRNVNNFTLYIYKTSITIQYEINGKIIAVSMRDSV